MNITPKTQQAYSLLHSGTLALARAERQGIRVDLEYTAKKKIHLTKNIERLERNFMETKFYKHWCHTVKNHRPNIHSDSQLGSFLYGVKKLEPTKQTASGKGSTDEEALTSLNIPELNTLLRIKKLKKLRDTYLSAFEREQVNGYLHPFFNLNIARTYRSSSDKPNFQNIPKRDKESMKITRDALFPRPGHQLLAFDFSGLEVCIAATYHNDPTMIKYITDPTSDMHGDMAAQIFMIDDFDRNREDHGTLRQAAKNGFVFPEFYGDYFKNCSDALACTWGELPHGSWKAGQGIALGDETLSDHMRANGIKSFDAFTEHIKAIEKDFWENRFPVYAKWKERWWKTYQKYGYISMHTGFTCSGVMGKNDVTNYPVQGAAFHCLLWSFIQADRIMIRDKWDTKIIGQIHDEIVLDAHPDEIEMVCKTIKKITCIDLPKEWKWINVPLNIDAEICDVDSSWSNKKKLKI